MLPATDWNETIPADEAGRFERYAQEMRALQGLRARVQGMGRALHARAQAGVEATFEVLPDLPEHARVAFFASPATYRAYVRFSNGSGVRQPDRKPDVRGAAIKVFGIPGKKIIAGLENAMTQDFLLIHTPAMPVRNADEFFALVRAAKNPLLLLPRLIGGLGFVRTLQVLPRLARGLSMPITSLATTRYFSAVPIRFGSYAVKLALAPRRASTGTARERACRKTSAQSWPSGCCVGPWSTTSACSSIATSSARPSRTRPWSGPRSMRRS